MRNSSGNSPKSALKNYLHAKDKFTPDYKMSWHGFVKMLFAVIFVVIEIVVVLWLVNNIHTGAFALYVILEVVGVLIILFDLRKDRSPSFRNAWMLILLLLPGVGALFYILWGKTGQFRKDFNTLFSRREKNLQILAETTPTISAENSLPTPVKRDLAYLRNLGHPAFTNTAVKYYPRGEDFFPSLFKDISQAKHTILLEYFIISDGYLWTEIKQLLIEKAQAGVQIFLLYDDLGCVTTTRQDIRAELAPHGIHALAFNPVFRALSRLHITYRTHQKIAVIDGTVGYTGGCNIGDEYANLYQVRGYWKDVAIRLEGPAVQGLSAIFLEMWATENPDIFPDPALLFNQGTVENQNYPSQHPNSGSIVVPFADGPVFTPQNPAETLYRQIINTARSRVWMMSPYLIVEDSLLQAMSVAAKSGVDVRLLCPKQPDSWYVGNVTRYNYQQIIKDGVKVFEYSPGYVHAKTFLVDDDRVITGSINLDFRSLNIQFENGCYLYRHEVIQDISEDFEKSFAVSEEITLATLAKTPWYHKTAQGILQFFAPLL